MCTSSCTRQIKGRHKCDLEVIFSANVQQVSQGLIKVSIVGDHRPGDLLLPLADRVWCGIPKLQRSSSPRTKDAILSQRHYGANTAKIIQLALDSEARRSGHVTNERCAVVDTSLVPTKVAIQQLITDSKRSGQRGVKQFEEIDRRARGPLKDLRKCIYYREPRPGAPHGSERALLLIVISDEGCLIDAAKYRRNGHGHDGKHKLCEDALVVDSCIVFRCCDKNSHPHVREFEGGYRYFDHRLVFTSITNAENHHCIRKQHEAVQMCMPCSPTGCSHPLYPVDFPDGSGYEMRRSCSGSGQQIKWYESCGNIDASDATVIAYRQKEIPYTLCDFHFEHGYIDYLTTQLRITSPTTLMFVVDGIRYLKRYQSKSLFLAGFELFKRICSQNRVGNLARETAAKLIAYMVWYCTHYCSCCLCDLLCIIDSFCVWLGKAMDGGEMDRTLERLEEGRGATGSATVNSYEQPKRAP